jgi:hypothetical protein
MRDLLDPYNAYGIENKKRYALLGSTQCFKVRKNGVQKFRKKKSVSVRCKEWPSLFSVIFTVTKSWISKKKGKRMIGDGTGTIRY